MDQRALRKKRDRELLELLNELRIALPCAQVLLAFLLVAPLNSGFDRLSGADRIVYLVALVATLGATVLLMAPSPYHRLRWREKNKEQMLRTANRLAISGMALLAVAVTAAVFVVIDVLYHVSLAAGFAVFTALLFALGWFALPLSRPYDRWDDDEEERDEGDEVG